MATPERVAELMTDFRRGDKGAAKQLVQLFHPELRRLAAAKMRGERTDHTWQPTALVNELYLELIRTKALKEGSNDANSERQAFLRLAGYLMKRLLIHHARPLYRQAEKLDTPEDISSRDHESLYEVENVLSSLATIDPKLRTVVEMKVFEGLTVGEIAARLDTSERTVARQWNFAKHKLQDAMAGART